MTPLTILHIPTGKRYNVPEQLIELCPKDEQIFIVKPTLALIIGKSGAFISYDFVRPGGRKTCHLTLGDRFTISIPQSIDKEKVKTEILKRLEYAYDEPETIRSLKCLAHDLAIPLTNSEVKNPN